MGRIRRERICFTTYDNYVNQSSFKHEKNSLCSARNEMSHFKIYYILMENCATKEMFLCCCFASPLSASIRWPLRLAS